MPTSRRMELDILEARRQFNSFHQNLAFLVLFETVDAADGHGLARARGPADNHPFPFFTVSETSFRPKIAYHLLTLRNSIIV